MRYQKGCASLVLLAVVSCAAAIVIIDFMFDENDEMLDVYEDIIIENRFDT